MVYYYHFILIKPFVILYLRFTYQVGFYNRRFYFNLLSVLVQLILSSIYQLFNGVVVFFDSSSFIFLIFITPSNFKELPSSKFFILYFISWNFIFGFYYFILIVHIFLQEINFLLVFIYIVIPSLKNSFTLIFIIHRVFFSLNQLHVFYLICSFLKGILFAILLLIIRFQAIFLVFLVWLKSNFTNFTYKHTFIR